MAGISGKSFLMRYCATAGGAYVTIADLSQGSFTINNEALDITAFAATYESKVAGLKSMAISGSGFWNSGDTNGQVALRAAMLADTDVFLQFLPNGTTGFRAQFIVTSWEIGAEVKGTVPVSFSAVSTGSITAV